MHDTPFGSLSDANTSQQVEQCGIGIGQYTGIQYWLVQPPREREREIKRRKEEATSLRQEGRSNNTGDEDA